MGRPILMLVLLTLLIAVALALVTLSVGQDRLLAAVLGPGNDTPVDLENLKRSGKPNDYLACPEGFGTVEPDEISPLFDIPASRLTEEWLAVIAHQPRTLQLDSSISGQLEFEQRSRFFRFPDLISVRFIPNGENESSVAIYSRSRYGYSDLGVNRERVRSWLKALRDRLTDE